MNEPRRGKVVLLQSGDAEIIMTIKPRHLRNMQKGIKRYELRKTRPRKHRDYRVWLCESGSNGKIVASFFCQATPEMTNCADDKIAGWACITTEEVRGYRKGGKERLFGWLIQGFTYFKGTERERHISEFGLERPPQSWCYAHEREGKRNDAER